MTDLVSSITMLAALALLAGSFYLWRYRKVGKQAALMAALAVVMLGNVIIWSIPAPEDVAAPGDDAAASGDSANP